MLKLNKNENLVCPKIDGYSLFYFCITIIIIF